MSKRTMIIAFVSLALAFIAYLSFKNDREKETPEDLNDEDLNDEDLNDEPEEKTVRKPKPPKLIKDEPIQQENKPADETGAGAIV